MYVVNFDKLNEIEWHLIQWMRRYDKDGYNLSYIIIQFYLLVLAQKSALRHRRVYRKQRSDRKNSQTRIIVCENKWIRYGHQR